MDHSKQAPSRGEIKQLRALTQRKNREAQGRFLAEGVRVVEDLLASRLSIRLVLATSTLEDNPRGQVLLTEVGRRRVPLRFTEDAELAEFAGTDTPQGVIAVVDQPQVDLEALQDPEVVLILDAVQDPGNFGTLVRTAEALGAGGVISLPGTVDAWNPKAVRAAAGSSFRIPVIAAKWDVLAPWLRGRGYQVLVAAADGARLGSPPGRSALVVGNEGAGVSSETLTHADLRVGIPLRGRAESLNVAAAAAILLYDLLR